VVDQDASEFERVLESRGAEFEEGVIPTTPPAAVPFNDLQRYAARIHDRLLAVTNRVIASGWYSLGPETDAFEAAFAVHCGAPHCVAVGNGTDALEIGLLSLGCEAGDEIVVAANAGMYATTACRAIGAVPAFADVDADTMLISIPSVMELVGPKTRAVVATHLYGNVVDVARLRDALPAGVAVLEDAAQAHGAARKEGRVGSLGDAAAFSFYPTKNLGALGDAGAVVTRDPEVARRARALRQYGWETRYIARHPGGRNSRIDEIQAAFLLELIDDLERRNDMRRAIRSRYVHALGSRVSFVEAAPDNRGCAAHLCVMRSSRRDALVEDLASVGVRTAVHYPVPDHLQPALSGVPFRSVALFETERACREVVSLPCFPELREDELERVISMVDRFA
jgi:dTDP-4-amino-4,6-dideoxygalactose transaminase